VLTIIMGLGTARLTSLICIDSLLEPLRDLLFHFSPPHDNDAKGWYYQCLRRVEPAHDTDDMSWWHRRFVHGGPMRKPGFFGQLVSCPYCVGAWAAAGNVGLYALLPSVSMWFNLVLGASFIGSALTVKYWR